MMSELYPHMDPRRDRLTSNQAVALVYVALVHPGTPGRGAWRGDSGNGDHGWALVRGSGAVAVAVSERR